MNSKTFRLVKRLSGISTKRHIPSLMDNSNIPITDDEFKVNVLADHFENVHLQNHDLGDPSHAMLIQGNICELTNDNNYIQFSPFLEADALSIPNASFHSEEVINKYKSLTKHVDLELIIKGTNNKRSSGDDKISNYLLKKPAASSQNILQFYLTIFSITATFP